MEPFTRREGALYAEDVAVADIAATHGTPVYIYSRAALESAYTAYTDALAGHPHMICYAVKANSNLAVLNVLARLGAGFDIVSIGELERVLAADLPSNGSSLKDLNCTHSNCETYKTPYCYFLSLPPRVGIG